MRLIDPLELALRRLPYETLLAVAGSVSRALMISNEIEPSRAKVVKAELLERTVSRPREGDEMSTDEHVRAVHARRERAERHVFLAMATVFALLALVAWQPQHADLGLWIIATPLILALGGLIVWIVGTFLALPLDAYYERRDKKHEGFGPAQRGGW